MMCRLWVLLVGAAVLLAPAGATAQGRWPVVVYQPFVVTKAFFVCPVTYVTL